jgi:hypothetical protein
VSYRDERRPFADVWTSGNRIFRCAGREVFMRILRSLKDSDSPGLTLDYVTWLLGRPLDVQERQQVLQTARQIEEIVILEKSEYRCYVDWASCPDDPRKANSGD